MDTNMEQYSETEYEYESDDYDDDEIIPYQTMWQNISSRIHFIWPTGMALTLNDYDDISVLSVLISTILEGVSVGKCTYMTTIESIENAILANPSKKHGYGRVLELKRSYFLLNDLPTPSMTPSSILELHIEDASEFTNQYVLYVDHHCSNLKRLTLRKKIPSIIYDVFESVEHAILDAKEIPNLKGKFTQNLKQLEIQNAQTFEDIGLFVKSSRSIDITLLNVILPEWLAKWLGDYIDLSKSKVYTEQQTILDYNEWRPTQTKRRKFNSMHFKIKNIV